MVLIDHLDDETFGEQLRRARARRRLNARDVAELMSGCWPVSHTLIHRLETEPIVPTDKRRRVIAALYAIVLGYEPAVFGLSRDDIPPAIDVTRLAPVSEAPLRPHGSPARPARRPGSRSFGWNDESADQSGLSRAA